MLWREIVSWMKSERVCCPFLACRALRSMALPGLLLSKNARPQLLEHETQQSDVESNVYPRLLAPSESPPSPSSLPSFVETTNTLTFYPYNCSRKRHSPNLI